MSCRLEPAIWSRDTGQQIPCFDRCQLIITCMSLLTYYLEDGRHLARLHRRCRRRAYASTSNTVADNLFMVFFPYMVMGPSARRSSAIKYRSRSYFSNFGFHFLSHASLPDIQLGLCIIKLVLLSPVSLSCSFVVRV